MAMPCAAGPAVTGTGSWPAAYTTTTRTRTSRSRLQTPLLLQTGQLRPIRSELDAQDTSTLTNSSRDRARTWMAATEARVGPPALRDGAEPQAMLNTARAWRPHPREVDAQQLPIVLGASAIDTNHRPREVGVADAPTSSPSCPAKHTASPVDALAPSCRSDPGQWDRARATPNQCPAGGWPYPAPTTPRGVACSSLGSCPRGSFTRKATRLGPTPSESLRTFSPAR
ncbi:hypothetical protein F4820DRAFT_229836 [Hypoxylon rubiginosum]|uniref:Uncharacterized protein n=1 Tax=Hypoxylon rubiginosum TaxID=110542 RepID=A0ACB9Z715_9PEZI|nr:hypothetical protein F4820DRAFT_229836 [Hypoxylon rubiginosum]